MELQLKNIGMIKEANVKIDGLTVIAGENDAGKSTVGKALYLQLKSIKYNHMIVEPKYDEKIFIDEIFHGNISEQGSIYLSLNGRSWQNDFTKNDFHGKLKKNGKSSIEMLVIPHPIMIETPIVFNLANTFEQILRIEDRYDIDIDKPFIMSELDADLNLKKRKKTVLLNQRINRIIGGQFQKDERGEYFFNKNDQRIELINTATGIKSFGILQILSQNNYLNDKTVLVLDEPEVHLHPKWQLKMAKIIVELVKNGVKIVVNSHSPYMIEALQRYSELEKVNSDFYLAEDGYIKKENDSNSDTLAKIFEKLSEPFDVFEEMESQKMENFING